jgi:aminoglycoside 3-N-acetyltransferase
MHGVEERVVPPYLLGEEIDYSITGADGIVRKKKMVSHDFQGWEQRYDRLEKRMRYPHIRQGRLLEAQSYLLEAEPMWQVAEETLMKNPLYFVDKKK